MMIPILTNLLSRLCETFFKKIKTITEHELCRVDFCKLWNSHSRPQEKKQPTEGEENLERFVLEELHKMLDAMVLWYKNHRHHDVEYLNSLRGLKEKVQEARKKSEDGNDVTLQKGLVCRLDNVCK